MDIEILEKEKLRIGEREFKIFYHDPPLRDGANFNLEASADDRSKHHNILKPYELRSVRGRDFPGRLSIMIESPKSHLKNMSLVHFENLSEGPTIKTLIYYDHADWHLPIHLVDFCELLRSEIASAKDLVNRVEVEESDGSINLICVAHIAPMANCHQMFQALDDLILRSYRACLRSLMKNTPPRRFRDVDASIGDGHGAKWWIRYVVVPLVVAIVALIALLLR